MRPSAAPVAATLGLLLGLLLGATPARAATLDVAADGDDLVFTWDTGVDDLLRGTSPDALGPWRPAVTSPLRVTGENAAGSGDSFYRLASGSNMAWRIELDVNAGTLEDPVLVAVSFPERREPVTAFQVLEALPGVAEVTWWDGDDQRFEHASRVASAGFLIGDDEPLPHHGGALLALPGPATLTLVGSDEPTEEGWTERDVEAGVPQGVGVLGLTPSARWIRGVELLCGEEGTDWLDANADGLPDDCGRDLDGDGSRDTGVWGDAAPSVLMNLARVDASTGELTGAVAAEKSSFDPTRVFVGGQPFVLRRGEGVIVVVNPLQQADVSPNTPFRPPTW